MRLSRPSYFQRRSWYSTIEGIDERDIKAVVHWKRFEGSASSFGRWMTRTWYINQINDQALLHCFSEVKEESTKLQKKKSKIHWEGAELRSH